MLASFKVSFKFPYLVKMVFDRLYFVAAFSFFFAFSKHFVYGFEGSKALFLSFRTTWTCISPQSLERV